MRKNYQKVRVKTVKFTINDVLNHFSYLIITHIHIIYIYVHIITRKVMFLKNLHVHHITFNHYNGVFLHTSQTFKIKVDI